MELLIIMSRVRSEDVMPVFPLQGRSVQEGDPINGAISQRLITAAHPFREL
jgi:hypothetical protein